MDEIAPDDIAMLLKTFSVFQPVKEDDIKSLIGFLKKATYKKGELIIEAGQTETRINFIVSGAVHLYTFVDGIQHTISIAQRVFNSYSSYYLECPSSETHEALSDLKVLYLEKSDVEECLKSNHTFCYIYAKLSEYILLIREQRATLLLHNSAEKRFRLFVEQHDSRMNVLNEIPQKVIANYLGLSPETYCREKNRYLKESQTSKVIS